MALNEWKQISENIYTNKNKQEDIRIYHGYGEEGQSFREEYRDRSIVVLVKFENYSGKEIILYKSEKAYNEKAIQKSKAQAIKFAKNYMKTH